MRETSQSENRPGRILEGVVVAFGLVSGVTPIRPLASARDSSDISELEGLTALIRDLSGRRLSLVGPEPGRDREHKSREEVDIRRLP